MDWSPTQYVKFEDERTRPIRDLMAGIPNDDIETAVDLGCGPGNSTELLIARFPEASVLGIDNSEDMIAAARARLPEIAFELHDIAAWSARHGLVDVILANAALQWVPDHRTLLPALVARLKPGGSLAVQMPHNLHEPAHRMMRTVAAEGPWADRLRSAARADQHGPDFYYDVLGSAGAAVNVWVTTYHHIMPDAAGVVEWFKGSALRPFLAPLDPAEREAFLALYLEAITPFFPPRHDGSVLLPFPRLFFVATRG
jgi:trans-aconitate 2-methyltransferase